MDDLLILIRGGKIMLVEQYEQLGTDLDSVVQHLQHHFPEKSIQILAIFEELRPREKRTSPSEEG